VKKPYGVFSFIQQVDENFVSLFLNASLTFTVYLGFSTLSDSEFPMSEAEYEAAVAAFLRTKGVTRCPTVCVVPTQATVAEADRAAYRDYVAAREAARLEKHKSLRQILRLEPLPPM